MKGTSLKNLSIFLLGVVLCFPLAAADDPPNAKFQYRPYEKFKVSLDNLSPEEVLIHQVLQQEPLRPPVAKRDPASPEIATCTALESLLGISYRNRYLGQKNVILDIGPYHIINLPFEDRFRGQHVLAIYKGKRFDRPESSLITLSFDLDYNFLTNIKFNDNLAQEVSELLRTGRSQKIALFKFLDETFRWGHQAPYGSRLTLSSFLPVPAPSYDSVVAQHGSVTAFYATTKTRQGRERPTITLRWKHPSSGRLEDLFSLEFTSHGDLTRVTQESFNFSPSFLATVLHVLAQENAAYEVIGRSLGLNYQPEFFGRWDREAPLAFAKRAFVDYWQKHPPVFLHPLSRSLSITGQNLFKALLGKNVFEVLGLDPATTTSLMKEGMARKERTTLKTYKKNIIIEYLPSNEVLERSDLDVETTLQYVGKIAVHKQGIQFDSILIDLAPDQVTINNIFYKKQNSPALLKRFLHKSAPAGLQDFAAKLATIVYQADAAAIERLVIDAEAHYADICTIQRAINDYYGTLETERFVRQVKMSIRRVANIRCGDHLSKDRSPGVTADSSTPPRRPSWPPRMTFKTNTFEDLGLKINF